MLGRLEVFDADGDYLSARRAATELASAAISTPVAEHGLEAIVALTANPACLTDYVLGDHDVFHTSGPAAVAGCPSITVPFGYVSGLPVGVSFFGPRWTEARLIPLASSPLRDCMTRFSLTVSDRKTPRPSGTRQRPASNRL